MKKPSDLFNVTSYSGNTSHRFIDILPSERPTSLVLTHFLLHISCRCKTAKYVFTDVILSSISLISQQRVYKSTLESLVIHTTRLQ